MASLRIKLDLCLKTELKVLLRVLMMALCYHSLLENCSIDIPLTKHKFTKVKANPPRT